VLLSLVALAACSPQADLTPADGGELVVAYFGDETITMAELEERAQPELALLELDRYEKLRQVLEQMAVERMLTTEAAARGVTPDELMRVAVLDKIGEPSEEEIRRYYERNKPRIGDRSLEQMRELIIKTIENNRSRTYQGEFVASLKERAGFRIDLDPPRAEIVSLPTELVRGAAAAPVTIVEFADFECAYCKRVHPTVERLLVEYGDKIRFVFRDYPLVTHERAVPASQAARCAAAQDKFWDYYQHLMAMKGDLGEEDLRKRAGEVGLDVDEFSSCYEANRHEELIGASIESGRGLGVTGTPTFFINGRRLVGAKSYDELKEVIEDELARSEPVANVGG
jgi:protein-disulfide isomerase